MQDENKVVYFAATDSRGKHQPFGIKIKDRSKHVYVVGKTGMGKSTLLENMAIQDIQNGEGLAFVDPHGKTADLLLEYVPESRLKDVIYFAPFDTDYPISFNVMEDVGADKRHLVANGLMSAFKKIWVDAWSARMEYILNNILLALLEYPDSTLIGVNRMLADKDYRNKVVANISDPSVKAFWTDEFAKYGDRYMQEAGAAIQNKIGQFIANPLVRNIIGQPKSTFDMRKVMDERKILIINLSKGRVGEANANLLGSMLVTKIYLGAMSRADIADSKMRNVPPFYLFVDEFQSFANESFADILSEARKYKLSLTIAHQYIEQMSEEVRAAVFGNVGTMITFRVGAYDAEVLEKEFSHQVTAEDLVNLGFTQIYLKLMIDGVTSPPFSASTLPPIEKKEASPMNRIIDLSRAAYARPRSTVEEEIRKWHEPVKPTQASKPREENHWGDKERRNFPRPVTPSPTLISSAPPYPPPSFAPQPPASATVKNAFADIKFDQRGTMQVSQGKENVVQKSEQQEKPLSLSSLPYKGGDRRKETKGATPESLASLKNVLSQVLREAPPKSSLSNRPNVVSSQVKKTETPLPLPTEPTTPKVNGPREISEAELKKILEADA